MGRKKHCTDEERRIILRLRTEGKTYKEISNLIQRSENMVTNAIKYKKSYETRGRPRNTTEKEDRRIVQYALKKPFATANEIKKELNLNLSESRVRRRLIQANLTARSPRKVPLLSKRHLNNRLKFAKSHLNWPVHKWRNVLWTDESKINLFGSDNAKKCVRRPKNKEYAPQYTIKTIKHGGGSVMI